jgi:hypothetical protein
MNKKKLIVAGVWSYVIIVLALAYWVINYKPYTAGDDVGYYMGMVGGIMMLSLLVYAARKRFQFFYRHNLGTMVNWFKYHMVVGILAPTIIVFHSTFRIGSMNARVALYSMLLVVFSGIIGRFLYRHIHKGLYGAKLTIADVNKTFEDATIMVGHDFKYTPAINGHLYAFNEYATAELKGVIARVWRFITLRYRGKKTEEEVRQIMMGVIKKDLHEELITKKEARIAWNETKMKIREYIDASINITQLAVWEKMFSLWHIIHVPFLWLLVITGIVHTFAVHMY